MTAFSREGFSNMWFSCNLFIKSIWLVGSLCDFINIRAVYEEYNYTGIFLMLTHIVFMPWKCDFMACKYSHLKYQQFYGMTWFTILFLVTSEVISDSVYDYRKLRNLSGCVNFADFCTSHLAWNFTLPGYFTYVLYHT